MSKEEKTCRCFFFFNKYLVWPTTLSVLILAPREFEFDTPAVTGTLKKYKRN